MKVGVNDWEKATQILFNISYCVDVYLLKVLNEDLRLDVGQQKRMNKGANVWNAPVSYDKLG